MTDLDIIIMYKKGYSINKIARKYKKMEKLIYKRFISLDIAKNIIENTLLYFHDSIYIDLLN